MIAKLSMICSVQSNGSYFAICPELRGCFTQGDTYEEAVTALRELIEITVREDLSSEELQEILESKAKIFSEIEIAV
jgi:predicted RNase H-like HicB family nuclease